MHFFILQLSGLVSDRISAFDNSMYLLVSGLRSEPVTGIMHFFAFLGSGWSLTPLVAVLLLAARRKEIWFRRAGLIALNYAAISLINYLLKIAIRRDRPGVPHLEDVGGYSFPSWHAMTAMAFFVFLSYLVLTVFKHGAKYLLTGAMLVLILLIGLSRIYLGVHYASDVLGGYIIGLIWVIPYIMLSKRVAGF